MHQKSFLYYIIFGIIRCNKGSIFQFFRETFLKLPSIYLETLVSMKCNYNFYNFQKHFGGAKITAI